MEGGVTVIHTAATAMSIATLVQTEIAKTSDLPRRLFKTMHIRVFDVSTTVVEAA